MKTIELNGRVQLTKSGRDWLGKQLGTLRGLVKLLRERPLPRGGRGRTEQSILGELELCIELGHQIARGECNAEAGLARFEWRYEAIVHGVFRHLESVGP